MSNFKLISLTAILFYFNVILSASKLENFAGTPVYMNITVNPRIYFSLLLRRAFFRMSGVSHLLLSWYILGSANLNT